MYTYQESIKSSEKYFNDNKLAAKVFCDKYALRDNQDNMLELTPDDMHHRLAKEFARIEKDKFKLPLTEEEIYELFNNFKYIVPQGSPLFGIGNNYTYQSLGNCFTLGEHPFDSYGGILYADQMLVQLSKRRCGVGICLDNIRPKGLVTKNAAKSTDGIAIFMERFSNSTREVAQCLKYDSKVLTKSGLKNICDVEIDDYVWTQKGWIKVINKYKNKKQVFKITTKRGYSIESSKDHVFLDKDLQEIKLSELNINDYVCLLPGTDLYHKPYVKLNNFEYIRKECNNSNRLVDNVIQPSILDEKLAYILGYSYGDGSVEFDNFNDPKLLCLACCNDYPTIKYKLRSFVKDVFNFNISTRKGDGNLERLTISNKIIVGFLKSNNILKEKSNKLIFPDKIYNSPPSVQMSFIAGLLDADGCCKGIPKRGIAIDLISKDFLYKVFEIFSSNGILSSIRNNTPPSRKLNLNWKPIYRLTICGYGFQTNAISKLQMSEKIQQITKISKKDSFQTPYKSSQININANKIKFINSTNNISYGSIVKLKNLKKIDDSFNPLLLDNIVNIEKTSIEETYDLELEYEHMFWCNGFYVHNSGRRGALLEGLSVHHPEIETFINIKQDKTKVTGANISVLITDEFMKAVKNNKDYEQRWPVDSDKPIISKKVSAKKIWDQIINAAWATAEPGVLFLNTAQEDGLSHRYHIKDKRFEDRITNPCGEIWMGMDSCRLMLMNLYSYVIEPFTKVAKFNYDLFSKHTIIAQRLMDDMVDLEIEKIENIIQKIDSDPEPDYIKKIEKDMWVNYLDIAKLGRRTGLGITALGDTLAALNITYGSKKSIKVTEDIYKNFAINSMLSSCKLSEELGPFPLYDKNIEKDNTFLYKIFEESEEVKKLHNKYGRRNISLTTTAPAGSISILTETTSGIEPAFLLEYTRRRKVPSGSKNIVFTDSSGDNWEENIVYHKHFKTWKDINNKENVEDSPYYNATANDIDWNTSVKLQSVAQKWITHSISKTCNIPNNSTKDLVNEIYLTAYDSRCKGFTVYRDGCRDGVLISNENNSSGSIKRPKEVPCDVHHVSVKGQPYFILLGIVNGNIYEIFAGKNGVLDHKIKSGKIVKMKRPRQYKFIGEDESELTPISAFSDNEQQAITRLISIALQAGTPIDKIITQLDKTDGDLTSFSKAVIKSLKKYIQDGTNSINICPECKSGLIYSENCLKCQNCGWSRC